MVRVCFAGITGWTAAALVPAIVAADDLHLAAGVSRSAAGRDLTDVSGAPPDGSGADRVYSSVAEALDRTRFDVLVDFTSAMAVRQNVVTAVDAGVNVVVGSSGLAAADYDEIHRRAIERNVGVVAAGNFSVMAAILRRAAALAAQHLSSWEIIDYASATKPDVPSGTSRELAETLAAVRRPECPLAIADLRGPAEARGAEVAGTRIHSVRLPSFVVSTEIVFGAPGEKLVFRHDPGESPAPYVAGTLLAIRRVGSITGLVRGVDSLLFDDSVPGTSPGA